MSLLIAAGADMESVEYVSEQRRKSLVRFYAEPRLMQGCGWTALFNAVCTGKDECISLLLENGANIKATDKARVADLRF